MPVRRPSVAVSKVDDVPNGEIRDLATPDAGDKDDEDSRINSPAYMTDHCYARPVDEKSKQFENQFANDHGYSRYPLSHTTLLFFTHSQTALLYLQQNRWHR